jgi:hypothetical protein
MKESRTLQALLSILALEKQPPSSNWRGPCRWVTQRALRFSAPRGGINKDGYRIYKLTLPSGEKRTVRVHRLVCEAWHGRPRVHSCSESAVRKRSTSTISTT